MAYGPGDVDTSVDSKDLGVTGNGGNGSKGGVGATAVNPLVNPNPAPAQGPAPTPAPTMEELLSQIYSGLGAKNLYALQQWGLAPIDATAVSSEWQPIFDREYNRIVGDIPDTAKSMDQLHTYFPDTFGDNALSAEQDRRRQSFRQDITGRGFENQLNTSFGDTADDPILANIYNQQYGNAKKLIDNQLSRGALNSYGYNDALSKLSEQGAIGQQKLQDIGGTVRTSTRGSLDDYLSEIYGKTGSYRLGEGLDTEGLSNELANRITSGSAGLEGNIRSQVPSLFDTSAIFQSASANQGQTSGNPLADILAQNREKSGRGKARGLGTTGAF